MSQNTIIILLSALCLLLLSLTLYQRFLRHSLEAKLKQISRQLDGILKADSIEQATAFTDNTALKELISAINCLLTDRQQMKADFRETEASSKRMLSNISHDIKTPLTVILGYLEILRLKNPEDEALKKTEAKAKQVMELITEFFTLAKLEAGDLELEEKELDINELCRKNILDFYDILMQKDYQVEISIPEKPILIRGDEKAVNRILSNLIANAVRYGSDGSYIGILVRETDSNVLIDIKDKGRGIDSAAAEHVFERLYTMEDSRSRNIQGNGLGLTIAKSLAGRLGGDILLESTPDILTIFTLILPKL